ncbi:hypothetical protein FRC12_019220 [Ceratobasidium sp. 428]|nr:hypothetical protein FRC12_019220 [Ceratobasidium sp. 428]
MLLHPALNISRTDYDIIIPSSSRAVNIILAKFDCNPIVKERTPPRHNIIRARAQDDITLARLRDMTGAVDYDGKIERAQTIIATVNSQRDQIKSKIAEIKHAWATIPDQVGQCLHAIWDHLTTDASHLRGRLEGSISDPMPDLSAITRVYTEINSVLRYYATNVNNMGR